MHERERGRIGLLASGMTAVVVADQSFHCFAADVRKGKDIEMMIWN